MSGLEVAKSGAVLELTLNRPKKKNCISEPTYAAFEAALRQAAEDDEIKLVTLTGKGDYYSSGNDLGGLMKGAMSGEDPAKLAVKARTILESFINAWIDFPKPIIALVQGPAVGIAVTTLALADVVYASDAATFHAPFTALGQAPEGCSSFLFPAMAGPGPAAEFLLLGRKWGAAEAQRRGLVTRTFPAATFRQETRRLVAEAAELPPQGLRLIKGICRTPETRAKLRAVNAAECELLVERWQGEECAQAVMAFFQAKSKL